MVGFAGRAEGGNSCDEFVRVVRLRRGAVPCQLLHGCDERLRIRGRRGDSSDDCMEGRNQREEHSSAACWYGYFRREQFVSGWNVKFWWWQYLDLVCGERADYLLDRLHALCVGSGELCGANYGGEGAVMQVCAATANDKMA